MKKLIAAGVCAVSLFIGTGLSFRYCQNDEQYFVPDTRDAGEIFEQKDVLEQGKLVNDGDVPEYPSDLEVKVLFDKVVDNSWAEYGVYLSDEILKNNLNCSLEVFEREIALVGEQINQICVNYGLDVAKQVYSSFFSGMYSEGSKKCKFHIIGQQIGKYIAEAVPLSVRWEKLLDEVRGDFGEKYPTVIWDAGNRVRLLNFMKEFDEGERHDKISSFCEGKKNIFTEPLVFLEPSGFYRISYRPEFFCREVLARFPDDFRDAVSWSTIPEVELGYGYKDILENLENLSNGEAVAVREKFAKDVAEEICQRRNSLPQEQFLAYRNLVIRNIEIISNDPNGSYFDRDIYPNIIDSIYEICEK